MIRLLKAWLKKYDAWCVSMGLTPDKRRSCVAHRSEKTERSADDTK